MSIKEMYCIGLALVLLCAHIKDSDAAADVVLGGTCDGTNTCLAGANSECTATVCVCSATYCDTNGATAAGTCLLATGSGVAASAPCCYGATTEMCGTGLKCIATGTCVASVALGVACSADIPCADANAKTCDATITTCVCADGYTKNSATPPVCAAGSGSESNAKSSAVMLTATIALLLRWFINL